MDRTLAELLEGLGATNAAQIEVGDDSPNPSATYSVAKESSDEVNAHPSYWARNPKLRVIGILLGEKGLLIQHGAKHVPGRGTLFL